jgi:hypothetical protein
MGRPRRVTVPSQWRTDCGRTSCDGRLIREITAMTLEVYTDEEPRSIGAAVRHGRFGSACAAAMVALTVAVSICAIALVLGVDGAFAAR